MKIIKTVFLLMFLSAFSNSKAQSISAITLSVDTSTTTGNCPHKIKFTAVITTAGQLKTVNLIWDKSDGTTVTQTNAVLSGKGNDTVNFEWLVNNNFNGTLILHVNTPTIHKSSNAIHFKSKCK